MSEVRIDVTSKQIARDKRRLYTVTISSSLSGLTTIMSLDAHGCAALSDLVTLHYHNIGSLPRSITETGGSHLIHAIIEEIWSHRDAVTRIGSGRYVLTSRLV